MCSKLKRSQESCTLNLDCDNMTTGRGACISMLFDMDPSSKDPASYSVSDNVNLLEGLQMATWRSSTIWRGSTGYEEIFV